MRIALLADIHANLPALEAVLRDIPRHSPDCILSLGDQINLGPCPRETLALLKAHGVTCLHGNHERYVLSAMAGDPVYDGVNFESLRYNARLLTEEAITFPHVLTLEGATFCHALPEDDRFPVFEPEKAVPRLAQMQAQAPQHIFCGHGHNPVRIQVGGITLDCIGSVGCMDEGAPGTTVYSILDIRRGAASLRVFPLPYDTAPLPQLFRQSGMADDCPIMAHIACMQMMHNHDYLNPFVTQARALADANNESAITREVWQRMDSSFPWPDGVGTAMYWR